MIYGCIQLLPRLRNVLALRTTLLEKPIDVLISAKNHTANKKGLIQQWEKRAIKSSLAIRLTCRDQYFWCSSLLFMSTKSFHNCFAMVFPVAKLSHFRLISICTIRGLLCLVLLCGLKCLRLLIARLLESCNYVDKL